MLRSKSLPHAAAAAALLALAACADRNAAMLPDAPLPAAPAGAAVLQCTVDVRGGSLACTSRRGMAPGPSAVILGGQGTNVRLTSSGTAYDTASSTVRSDVTVENLTAQVLGTADGVTAAPEGVRVFFASGPTVTAGTGAVTVANADGQGVFTGAAQPYFQYGGLLLPGDTTPAKEWRFSLPPTVTAFVFTVYVAAPVRSEAGWVSVRPIAPSLVAGDTTRLTAAVKGVTGAGVEGAPVAWSTSNPAVATVDSLGLVTAVGAGSADVTATSGGRTGRVTVIVEAPADAYRLRPTVVDFVVAPGTVTANGADSVHLRATVRNYFIAELDFVVSAPGLPEFNCRGFHATPVNATETTWECAFVIRDGARGGPWRVVRVDAFGNNLGRPVDTAALLAAGAPAYFNVRSPNEDVTAPVVTGLSFSADSVAAGSGVLRTYLATADAGLGTSQFTALFRNPQASAIAFGCLGTRLTAGTPNSGTLSCDRTFPDWVHDGTWTLDNVDVKDPNGNHRVLRTADLAAAGFPTTVTVVNPDPDLTPPSITAFSFAPDTVAANGVDSVSVTLSASDARSTVYFVDMEFENAAQTQTRRCQLNGPPQASLTMTCAQRFAAADAGAWHVLYVRAIDLNRNERVLSTADLQAAGYPTALTVSP